LGNLTNLSTLDLETNQLSGSLPPQLGNLTNLVELDLYNNQLSGSLPLSLENLHLLEYFYFSSTNLCVPSDAAFEAWLATIPNVYGTSAKCAAPPPDAPLLNLPADNANPVGTPLFSWAASAGANAYQFQYDNDADFSSPTYTSAVLSKTSFTPPAMALGTFHWHVKARNASGGWSDWSVGRTVNIQPPLPAAPKLTAPLNGALTSDNTPTFTWGSVTNGLNYEIQLSTSAAFTPTTKDATVSGLTYTTDTALADGTYSWRVLAINSTPAKGAWSAVRTITVDATPPDKTALNLPVDGSATRSPAMPTFNWTAPAGSPTGYQFEYSADSTFGSGVTTVALTTTSYHPASLAAGIWRWRVKAHDLAGNWGAYSDVRSVIINAPLNTAAPVLVSPANGTQTNNPTPVLTWKAAKNGNTYHVQIASDAGFTSIVREATGAAGVLSYTVSPALPGGTYYWRVQAYNASPTPEAGPWSLVRTLIIDLTPPDKTALNLPLDGSVTRSPATPTFSWTAPSGSPTGYQFEYSADSGFGSGVTTVALTTTSYHPASMAPGIWHWRVKAHDLVGNWGAYSDVRSVIINAPLNTSAPVLVSPANGTQTNNTTPALTWKAAKNGNTYHVQIASDAGFTSIVREATGAMGVLSYPVSQALPAGTYYWRVQAFNASPTPEAGPWSLVRTFVID
jgi:hypothetical protein